MKYVMMTMMVTEKLEITAKHPRVCLQIKYHSLTEPGVMTIRKALICIKVDEVKKFAHYALSLQVGHSSSHENSEISSERWPH